VAAARVWWQKAAQLAGQQDSGGGRAEAAMAARWRCWQCKVNGGSAVAAGRCLWEHSSSSAAAMSEAAGQQHGGSRALFVGTHRQLSGSNEWGGRVAGHGWQRLQQSGGGSGSTATEVSTQWRQQQRMGAGQQWQRGSNRAVLVVAASWQRRQSSGDSAAAARQC
jgi:hypothetical protein